MAEEFQTKDSGERQQFDSGMVRDTQAGKNRLDLALDGPLPEALFIDQPKADAVTAFLTWHRLISAGISDITLGAKAVQSIANYEGGLAELFIRYAALMTRGAVKYSARNWMQASGQAELERFISSASRHFFQWYKGDRDEDHAAAVVFNINGAAYVLNKLQEAEHQANLSKLMRPF